MCIVRIIINFDAFKLTYIWYNSISLIIFFLIAQEKEEFETQFLFSEQVFSGAKVAPTNNVCLWLETKIIVEHTLDDAIKLLTENIAVATRNLCYVEYHLDFP